MLKMVRGWAKDIGGIKLEFESYATKPESLPTPASEDYPWFKALKDVVKIKHGLKIDSVIMPAGSDAWFLRQKGIGAYGFTPFNKTPILLHDHNEFLNESIFLKGIDIMEDVVEAMASVP